VEQLRKEMPPKKTELEAALDTYRKMEIGLGLRNEEDPEKKSRRARKRPMATRRTRKPVQPRARRHNRPPTRVHPADDNVHDDVHDVHDVHDVQDVPEVPSAPTPAAQTDAAPDEASSLRLDEQPIRNPQSEIRNAADPASSQSPDSPNTPPLQPPTESSPIVPNRA
jgi:hypothetical protein